MHPRQQFRKIVVSPCDGTPCLASSMARPAMSPHPAGPFSFCAAFLLGCRRQPVSCVAMTVWAQHLVPGFLPLQLMSSGGTLAGSSMGGVHA